jgi:hypothetical protein
MTTWSLFVTAILQAFALPVLTVALILGLLDNLGFTSFFVPQNFDGNWIVNNFARRSAGGQPLLFQHLFLVLLAPGRLHHGVADDGHGLGYYRHPCPQTFVRL